MSTCAKERIINSWLNSDSTSNWLPVYLSLYNQNSVNYKRIRLLVINTRECPMSNRTSVNVRTFINMMCLSVLDWTQNDRLFKRLIRVNILTMFLMAAGSNWNNAEVFIWFTFTNSRLSNVQLKQLHINSRSTLTLSFPMRRYS